MLVRSQFKRSTQEKENKSSLTFNESSNFLEFEPILQPSQSHLRQPDAYHEDEETAELMRKASLGYVNEVYEILTRDI